MSKKPIFFVLSRLRAPALIVAVFFSLGAMQLTPNRLEAAQDVPLVIPEPGANLAALNPPVKPKRVQTPAKRPTAKAAVKPAVVAPQPALIGSLGYALAYGNCVNEPGVNNPHWGNPIDWPVLSSTPTIGATALFTWNHVGIVTGIWSNGDLEIRHQNYWGGQHRFPRSFFRGFR